MTSLSKLRAIAAFPLFMIIAACGGGGSGGGESSPPPAAAPTVTLSVSSPQVAAGSSVTLNWTTQNALSCTASGAWSGAKSTAGAEQVTVSANSTFNLSCSGAGGASQASTAVTVVPAPTVTISASASTVVSGSQVTLTWASQNATSCTASGSWSGTKATSGAEQLTVTNSSSYVLSCSGIGGTTQASTAVQATNPPPAVGPTVTLSASKAEVFVGSSVTLTWSAPEATSCSASGNLISSWNGLKPTSGSESIQPTGNSTYQLVCTNAGGSGQASVAVRLLRFVAEASPTTLDVGGSATVRFFTRDSAGVEIPVTPSLVAADLFMVSLSGTGSTRTVVARAKGIAVIKGTLALSPDPWQEATAVIDVINTPPVARIVSPGDMLAIGNEVEFDGSQSADADGDVLTYVWSLVDAPAGSQAALIGGSVPKVRIALDKPGAYQVSLSVRDARTTSPTVNSSTVGATPISGNLQTKTFDKTGSPYLLTDAANVLVGETVTVAEGVELYGKGRPIRVFGTLKILGLSGAPVQIYDTIIYPAHAVAADVPPRIEMQFAEMTDGIMFKYDPSGAGDGGKFGSFSITDSTFLRNGNWFYINRPTAPSVFARNRVIDSERFYIWVEPGMGSFEITNNQFDGYSSRGISAIWLLPYPSGNPTEVPLTINKNSFLDVGAPSVELRSGSGIAFGSGFVLDATSNYWGTTDPVVIQQMILDVNDNPALIGTIKVDPILATPDPVTPN